MALVDYSSSDSASEAEPAPPPKRLKQTSARSCSVPRSDPRVSDLPPLPPAFHDLYAHTVRASTADNPSLHQGRTRQIPHVAGNWPSHLYVEWHPTAQEHAALAALLAALRDELGADAGPVSSLLASDLGVPLPLHISLSRSFVLTTDEKDGFLEEIAASVRAVGITAFDLYFTDLLWYRSPGSNRSFLVLPVCSSSSSGGSNLNPELTALLQRFNDIVASYGQPRLYHQQGKPSAGRANTTATATATAAGDEGPEGDERRALMGAAFHVSLAWSFGELDDDRQARTADLFHRTGVGRAISAITLRAEAVKAKIGNAITALPLKPAVGAAVSGSSV